MKRLFSALCAVFLAGSAFAAPPPIPPTPPQVLLGLANTWTAAQTFGAPVTVSGASFGLSGNISGSGIFGTSGIRYKNAAATLNDTTASGTIATAYTDIWGGNTYTASNATTLTNLYGSYFNAPTCSTNVTCTNVYALGADSAQISGLKVTTGNVAVSNPLLVQNTAWTTTTLGAALTSGTTGSVSVGSTTGWPSNCSQSATQSATSCYFSDTNTTAEIMSFYVVDSTHINVLARGLFGTTASAHSNSDTIAFVTRIVAVSNSSLPAQYTLSNNYTFFGGSSSYGGSINFAATSGTQNAYIAAYGGYLRFAVAGASPTLGFNTNGLEMASTYGYTWSSGSNDNGTIDTTMCRQAAGVVEIGASTGCAASGSIRLSGLQFNSQVLISGTAPSAFSAGLGSTTSLTYNSGTGAFAFTIGGTGITSTGTITMPAASHGWICKGQDNTTNLQVTTTGALSTTTPTITFYNMAGTATAPTTGDVVSIMCMGL